MKFIKVKENVWVNMEEITFVEFLDDNLAVLHLPDSSIIAVEGEDAQILENYLSQVQNETEPIHINTNSKIEIAPIDPTKGNKNVPV